VVRDRGASERYVSRLSGSRVRPGRTSRASLLPVDDHESLLEFALVPASGEVGDGEAGPPCRKSTTSLLRCWPRTSSHCRSPDVDEPAPLETVRISDRIRRAQLRDPELPGAEREGGRPTEDRRPRVSPLWIRRMRRLRSALPRVGAGRGSRRGGRKEDES
jgi:hypothetical protein